MSKIASNLGTATSVISGISGVSVNRGQQVTLSKSNITSMTKGTEINNQLLTNLSELADCVKVQSQKFPKIAEIMAMEDSKIKF